MNRADRESETSTDMSHPLIQRLYDEFSYPRVTLEDYETFIGAPGVSVLFFAGDPKRYKETTDVAVVLPELIAAFEGNIRAGVVDKSAELPLQKRLGFRAWPCLVFFRDGGYLGAIARMKNWSEYLDDISEFMRGETCEPPTFASDQVPVRGPAAATSEVNG